MINLPKFTKLPVKFIASLIAFLFLASTFTYAASPNTLPTSPLYPIKKAWEALTLTFAATPDAKAQAMIDLANQRLAEAKALVAQVQTNTAAKAAVAPTIQASQGDLKSALDQAKKVSNPTKRKELLNEVGDAADNTKKEIEQEVEKKTELNNSEKSNIQKSKDNLDKTSTEAKSSD